MFLGLVFISIEGSGSMGSVLVYDVVSISIHGFAFRVSGSGLRVVFFVEGFRTRICDFGFWGLAFL